MTKVIKLRSRRKGGIRFQPGVTRGLRSVSIRTRSFDPSTRRFSFVLASETPCRTWRLDQRWNPVEVDEVLPMANLRGLDTFRGCPLLDTHSSWSVHDVLGRITALRVEGAQLVGDAFLSDHDDVSRIARDMETGILGEFSVGFDVLEDGVVTEREGDVPLVRIGAWSVREGSLVPLPADPTASMRSSPSARSISLSRGRSKPVRGLTPSNQNGARAMTPEELKTLLTETFATVTDTLVTALTEDDAGGDDLEAQADAAAEEARAAFLASKGKSGSTESDAGARSAADKTTIAALRAACSKRGLAADFDAMEKSGATVAELRGVLAAGLRTSKTEIDGTSKGGAGGKQRGKLMSFAETSRGKAAAK